MSSSTGCGNDCTDLPDFPRRITNRPGLDTIDYRIGDYTAMRAHMLEAIDVAPALAAWTHRRADDPGIALIEASAIVGDILALYQQTYANEAFLRTAAWRDTVAELVRVIGYRLAPGLSGRARFAIAVKGLQAVTLPKGFAITAKLPSNQKPAQFEATQALLARPALSKFHLYRPRYVPAIVNGSDTFQLDIGNAIVLAKGDRLLVATAVDRTLRHTQILVVEKVWEAFGVRLVKTQGKIASLIGLMNHLLLAPALINPISLSLSLPLALHVTAGQLTTGIAFLPAYSGLLQAGLATALVASASELRVYKLGPSVRHFGHSAPPTRVAVDGNGHATEVGVTFSRRLNSTQGDPVAPSLRASQWPLDGEPAGFAAGTHVLIEANLSASEGSNNAVKRVIERDVTQIDRQSLAWGTATGASTVLGLDDDLAISEGTTNFAWTDIRGVTVHAVQGEPFRIRAPSQSTGAARSRMLDYFGSHDDALALQDRTVLLAGNGAGPISAQVQAVTARPAAADPQFHTLTLDTEFALADYDHITPKIDVYANLLDTTQGKTEAEVPIGDGDARADFQTFAIPKAPLSYLLDTTAQPPQVPELEIRVGGLLWQRVPSLFGRGRKEAIYIVRESSDGASSYVQFGDGRNGARLPSGKGNVVALWRTGTGAHGLPAGSDKPSAVKRLPGFDDVFMLEPATSGALPENAANAKRAAPATMQSLGRIVSLADFEAEALLLPGVLKANAACQVLDGVPLVALTVLIASGAAADAAAIDLALRHALAARGPARWSLMVRHGNRRAVQINLALAIDPALRSDDITPLIQAALGVEDNDPTDDSDLGERGLMHWRMRNFGQALHGSQIVGAVQRVDGVRWVELRSFALGTTRLLFTPISFIKIPPVRRSLRAAADELLTLPRSGLSLSFVSDQEMPR